jgi:hypothetical protein
MLYPVDKPVVVQRTHCVIETQSVIQLVYRLGQLISASSFLASPFLFMRYGWLNMLLVPNSRS